MNWYKAKTILIVFFIFTNAFLFYNVVKSSKGKSSVSEEIVTYTEMILKNNGITIDGDIIPRKSFKAEQFEADNIITGYEEFAKKTLGENTAKLSDNVYQSELGMIEYAGDSFKMTVAGDGADELSLLKEHNINISDYEYINGVFKKKVNDLYVFNSEITVSQNEQGKSIISGVWFEKNSNSIAGGSSMKPITSVLIDFISSPERPQGNIEITGLKWGYMTYDTQDFHKSIVPVPAWKIELANGNHVFMDARAN